MTDEEWEEDAAELLRRFVLWWESDSPDRRLDSAEAHDLANHVLAAKFLLAEYADRKGERKG